MFLKNILTPFQRPLSLACDEVELIQTKWSQANNYFSDSGLEGYEGADASKSSFSSLSRIVQLAFLVPLRLNMLLTR